MIVPPLTTFTVYTPLTSDETSTCTTRFKLFSCIVFIAMPEADKTDIVACLVPCIPFVEMFKVLFAAIYSCTTSAV